jgi:hypothetical protein
MSTWNDLITQAFVNLGVIQPGEGITTSMQTDAQTRLNQLLSSLSTEQLTAFNQVKQSFSLVSGTAEYTLGAGGTFPTTGSLRAVKVTSWRAYYSTILSGGGPVLPMDQYGAIAQQQAGEVTSIPKAVGADTAYPLIHVRVFPPPSNTPGTIELAYYTPVTQISDFTVAISLPEGWEEMLQWGLAVQLYSQYARPGQTIEVIASNAQNAKASIVAQNTIGAQAAQ